MGADHPTVAIALNNLAMLLRDTNRLDEAEPLTRRALDIFTASLGPNDPKSKIVAKNHRLLLEEIDAAKS